MSQVNTPARPLPLIAACTAITLLGLGWLYVRAAETNPPHWVQLAMPLQMALFGLVLRTYPERMGFPSTVWQRRFTAYFFLMSALMLILFFV